MNICDVNYKEKNINVHYYNNHKLLNRLQVIFEHELPLLKA